MAEISFPGKLILETHDAGLRRRQTTEQPSSSRSISSRDGLSHSHRSRGSTAATQFVLQDFYAVESDGNQDSAIHMAETVRIESHINEPVPIPTPLPGGRSIFEAIIQSARAITHQGRLDPPRIPDPEIAFKSTTQLTDYQSEPSGILTWIRETIRGLDAPISTAELVQEVEHHFPCRANLAVQVFDFYEDRAERSLTTLSNIESVMSHKPEGVEVRWIHAPLGVGLFHSSVEDIFLKGKAQEGSRNKRRPSQIPRGKFFNRTGRAGWPYLETEILNVRSIAQMERTREIARAFLKSSEAQKLLDEKVFDHNLGKDLVADIKWRASLLKRQPDYWETAKSDLPLLLSDGAFNMKSPAATKQQPSLTLKKQTLQEDPAYRYAYLARDSFRCFHRDDNFLLSLSPSTGIDYVNSDIAEITGNPCRYLSSWRPSGEKTDEFEFPNEELSVIAHIFALFKNDGTKRWHHNTAEWLMVYLMTEIACTPHSMRSGYSVATILDAYDAQVNKLIERKFEPWTREETAKLFQSYLKTIDELKSLGQIYKRKLSFLKNLADDCTDIELELREQRIIDSVHESMTMVGKVKFAVSAVGDLVTQCEQLTGDLTASLNLMFQLRSIEQNDRSISVDSQSRAVLILSGVTIIFLPLSFLASFFSMNVRGLAETPPATTLGQFWKICGLITMVLVIAVSIFLWRVRSGNHVKTLMTVIGTKVN